MVNAGNRKVGFVASSSMADLIAAVACFRITGKGGTIQEFVAATDNIRKKRMKGQGRYTLKPDEYNALTPEESIRRFGESKILAVNDQEAKAGEPAIGIPVEYIPFAEVNEAWSSADYDESVSIAEKWKKDASI